MTENKKNLPEDMKLFREVVSDAKPVVTKTLPPEIPSLAKASGGKPATGTYTPAAPAAPPPAPRNLRAGDGVDTATLKKFQAGEMMMEAVLDLHGFTAEQASQKLNKFITDTFVRGSRCVLIITGKGEEGGGVLKREVPRWLESATLVQKILAISEARPKHGGQGALYVLLRRQR